MTSIAPTPVEVARIIEESFDHFNVGTRLREPNQAVWDHIFERAFGRLPSGDHDPLWDTLFGAHRGGKYALRHVSFLEMT